MRVSCIIPAYNEESTVSRVIRCARRVKAIDEVIVVDDGSSDHTVERSEEAGAVVIRHEVNKGKGAAIKTGFAHANGDIILLLDADLRSLTPKKVETILQPIQYGDADFVKTSFTRNRGRVTELVAKPLFRVILPFIKFNQPLSGQIAIRRELINELKIDDKWGVDIQMLIQSMKRGRRVVEVDIGKLTHKKQPLENLTDMSEQVIKTVLSELGVIANKHKLILFDFDQTIIQESSIEVLAREFGFTRKLKELRKRKAEGDIPDSQITLALAYQLKGKSSQDIQRACEKLHLEKNVKKVIERLQKRRYTVGIVSSAFSPVIYCISDSLGIKREDVICPSLVEDVRDRYTGKVRAPMKSDQQCCDLLVCKADAARRLMHTYDVQPEECLAVGDGRSDECLFRVCGLSLGYKARLPFADKTINNLAEVLIYAD